jgi:two-component system CheB/CheR fusion protein
VFAHHNILKDAPFTRLDLLTCRNLLIYLNPSAQRRALSLFHFALKAGGIMVLGPSESPGPLSEEFAAIDTRWKIYRKFRDLRLPGDVRVGGTVSVSDAQRGWLRQSGEDARLSRGREALLKRYAPPAVLVDGSLRVLHTFGGAAELFTHRDGPPTVNLLELLDGELRYASSSALKRAQKERAAVTLAGINAPTRDGERRVRVVVEPIESSPRQDESWLVTFEAELAAGDLPRAVEAGAAAGDEHDRPRIEDLLRDRVATLENELRAARHNLQATLEEMETSNEELQATNEELIASNEELQSTNEELHSVNEELYTVNAEYQQKINELTELHADLNNLLEGTAVHTLFLDGELKIRKFTPRIAETFNLLPQDTGRRFDTFAHSLHDERLVDDIRQVLGDGHTVEREVASGTGAEYFLRIMPYRGRAEMPGVVITLIDISALKRAQRELTLSEERYRTLLRSITAAFFNTDVDGRFGVQQDEWQAFTGQPWEEHRGHGWLAAFHPEDRERVRAERDEARAAGQAFEVEARLYSQSDQRYRWTTVRMAPLVGEGERPREWAGYVVDIHERRAAAAELRKKNEQIKAIVDYSPAFIWLKDPSGRYLMAGRQCDSLLGVSPEAIVGKTDFDLMPVGEADRARACERRALETGEPVESEDTYTIDGEQRTSLTLRFPLRDDHGTVYAVAGIASDITERKRTVEEAREAVLRRDRFLAMLSHELRTPLGAILNASNLLARQLDGHATGSGLDIIRRQARHMARLIDDLLDIGRITRDELVIERLPVDLGQAVREVVESSRPVFEDAGVALHVRLPEQPLCVRGDGVRLRQILANLLSNAVNYTPRGGKVWVDGEAAGGRALVTVKDTGVGMSLEELGRVFELFYQAPQPLDRPRGGLGIGLTLAQRLARVHGGELDASSEGRGCGSTFQVVIPLLDSDAAREASATPAAPSRKLRIAIVEDNNDIRETLRDLLALDGHEVLTADDGKDGMDLILRERPDLALVDVGLPRVDGYEVARRTKAACGNATRVVALTGYGRQEDRLKAIEAGFDEHFVKPVEVEALSRLLADVERRKRPEA